MKHKIMLQQVASGKARPEDELLGTVTKRQLEATRAVSECILLCTCKQASSQRYACIFFYFAVTKKKPTQ
jgi:hypothetical protein